MEKLQKQLLADFILKVPGRPFEEVIAYAKDLQMSNETIRDTILSISQGNENSVVMEKKVEKFVPQPSILNQKGKKPEEIKPSKRSLKQTLKGYLLLLKRQKKKVAKEELIPLSEADLSKIPQQKKRFHHRVHLKKHLFISLSSIVLALVALAVFRTGIIKTSNIQLPQMRKNLATLQASTTKSVLGTDVVFANQESIDPTELFSSDAPPVTLEFTGTPRKTVFGFMPYWMLPVSDKINFSGLTHVGLFGLTSDGKGNIITTSGEKADGGWNMWRDKKLDDLLRTLKKKKIKPILTIKSFDNTDIRDIVLHDESQRTFIANALELVNSKSLDGINIDFEYTGTSSAETTFAFTRFIANLNAELKRQIPQGELSVDTYLSSGTSHDLYDVELLSEYVDAIIVMGYDVHSPATDPGPVAPLEGDKSVLGYMQSYIERVPANKLILAVPYYGYDWELSDQVSSDSASIRNPGSRVGILPYADIVNHSESYTLSWDETAQTPYYTYVDSDSNKTHVLHFENTRSLGLKFDYINRKNLKGVGIWALGYDGVHTELQKLLFSKFAR